MVERIDIPILVRRMLPRFCEVLKGHHDDGYMKPPDQITLFVLLFERKIR
jgi:hypothetical protein